MTILAERLLPRLVAELRPELETVLRAAVVDDLRDELRPQLAAELDEYRLALTALAAKHRIELGDRALEQARDVIVARLQEERKLWREYDRNAPPKRRWWQRRETPKPSTKSMMGVG